MKTSKSIHTTILATTGLATLLGFAGCSTDTVKSSDVKQSTIYRSYIVTFDQRTMTTSLYANFRVGGKTGTNVQLEKPSDVSVSAADLTVSSDDKKLGSALGAIYQWESPSSSASPEVKFLWTRQDSSTIEDKLTPPATSPIAIEASQFSLASGMVIRLKQSVEPATVDIIVRSDEADSKSAFAIAQKKSATEYTVASQDLAKFKPGKLRIDARFTSTASMPSSDLDLGGIKSYTINMTPVTAQLK